MYRRQRRRRRRVPLLFLLIPIVLIIVGSMFFVLNRGIISYRKGVKALQKENYVEACQYLEKASLKKPDSQAYQIAYGLSLTGKGEYEAALKEFNKAISDKDTSKVQIQNKKAYRGIGICYFFAKNYENTIIYLDKALAIKELDYLNLDILKYKADAQTHLGEYESAVKIYSKIIEEEGYSESIYLNRADAKSALGDIEGANADYDYVISKSEHNYDAYLGAYMLLMNAGKDEKADSYLEAALKIEPDTADERLKYAVIQYYFYGITDEAVESLEKLIEQGQPEAYFYLAKIYYAEQELDKVSTYLKEYVSKEEVEHTAEAYEMLGRCAMLVNDYDSALEWFETGIACGDSRWTQKLKKDQIAVYEHLSDFSQAYIIAEEYLKAYPDDKEMLREMEFIKTRLSKE